MATKQQLKEMSVDEMMEMILDDLPEISKLNIQMCYFWSFSNVMKVLPELMKYNLNFSVDGTKDRMIRRLTIK